MTSRPITIYRLRVALADITPPIWRLVEVPSDFSLDWLHDVLQWAMDWDHQHPYRFYGGEFAYVEAPEVHDQQLGKELDATRYTLQKVYGPRGRYLRYVYDLHDSWWHHVWLEDTFPAAMEIEYPRLVDGRRAAPPENFGGIGDYRAFVAGELDADDPRHQEMADFDPESFDATARPFPNARTYVEGQQQKSPTRPIAFQPLGADSYGALFGQVESMLHIADAVGTEFRADLRRALEDLTLAEDALPPKTADTLRDLRSMDVDIDIDDLLLECMRRCEMLIEHNSAAPFHAAHLLALWRVDGAVGALGDALLKASDDSTGLVDTLTNALAQSGAPGIDWLLDHFDELSPVKRSMTLDTMGREEIEDDRLFDLLQRAADNAGPENPSILYLLSQYDDQRASDILVELLDDEIDFLTEHPEADDDLRARRTDYALLLTEMLAESGEELDEDRWQALDELEDFYWPSPAYRKRLRQP